MFNFLSLNSGFAHTIQMFAVDSNFEALAIGDDVKEVVDTLLSYVQTGGLNLYSKTFSPNNDISWYITSVSIGYTVNGDYYTLDTADGTSYQLSVRNVNGVNYVGHSTGGGQ